MTGRLARYMAAAREQDLPPEVLIACKHRILDTLAAMVSGARMRPGEMALTYVRTLGGTEQAGVVASGFRTTTVNAALANAMCAHADETDDFEPVTKAHPGCATVPAALALAERHGNSGAEFVRAVALGYDLCCRLLLALGPDLVRGTHRSAEGTSSTFGALGAAASLARLDERGMRFALSYAAQQVSGLWSWVRDEDHVEKAFDFAGMGARNGVTAVGMVEAGLTGVSDVLDGRHNLLNALSTAPKPELMLEGLGSRFFVTETAIKTFSVGYPIQSPLDATLTLRRQYGLTPEAVRHILVKVPTDAVGIVGSSAMPDVSCQHLVALALVKGAVSFADSHDAGLMHDPAIAAAAGQGRAGGRSGPDGPRRPARRHRDDDPGGRPHRRAPHPASARHQGEPAEHRGGERQGAGPDGAGARTGRDRAPDRHGSTRWRPSPTCANCVRCSPPEAGRPRRPVFDVPARS